MIAKLERKLEVMHEATLSIAQSGSCTPDDPKDFFTSLKKNSAESCEKSI